MNEISAVKSGFSAKKKLLIALIAVVGVIAVAVSSVFATVAYLTSSSTVSNVFTIGKVGIVLDEGLVDPQTGRFVDGGRTRTDANSYHLIPGKTYDKDPTIHINAESEKSYVFVVLRNDIKSIAANNDQTNTDTPTIHEQMLRNGWAVYAEASTGHVYVYTGVDYSNITDGMYDATKPAKVVEAGQNYVLFRTFSIADDCEDKLPIYGGAQITVTAYAIQDEGFANIGDAWTAIKETYDFLHTNDSTNTGGGTDSN